MCQLLFTFGESFKIEARGTVIVSVEKRSELSKLVLQIEDNVCLAGQIHRVAGMEIVSLRQPRDIEFSFLIKDTLRTDMRPGQPIWKVCEPRHLSASSASPR